MNYQELVEKMRATNKVYENRFRVKGKEIMIGSLSWPLPFSENNYKKVLEIVNEYGMFKKNEDCLGNELYYKGLKWNDLTEQQRQSVIDLYKDDSNYVSNPKEQARLFEEGFCLLEY